MILLITLLYYTISTINTISINGSSSIIYQVIAVILQIQLVSHNI